MGDGRFDRALGAFVDALEEDADYETVDWEIEHRGERYGTLDELAAALPDDVAYGGFADYDAVRDIAGDDAAVTSELNGYPVAFDGDDAAVAGYIEQASHLLDNYIYRDQSAGDAVTFHQVYPPFVAVNEMDDGVAYDVLLVTAEREMRPCDASAMRFPGSVVHASGVTGRDVDTVADTLRDAAPAELGDAVAGDRAESGDEALPELEAVDDEAFAPYEEESFGDADAYIGRMQTLHDNVERMRAAARALDRFFKAWAARQDLDIVGDDLYDAVAVDDAEYAEIQREAEAAVDRLADGHPDDGGVLQVLQETDMALKHEFPSDFRTDLKAADKEAHDALWEETYTTSYRTMENDLSSKSNNTAVELFVPVMNDKPDPFDLFGAANFIAMEGIDDYEEVLDTFVGVYEEQREAAVDRAEEKREWRQRHYQ